MFLGQAVWYRDQSVRRKKKSELKLSHREQSESMLFCQSYLSAITPELLQKRQLWHFRSDFERVTFDSYEKEGSTL